MGIFIDDMDEIYKILNGLKLQEKRIVFTNGVFDLLHVGHIRSLKDAASRGDFLVVAVNSDKSARKLKGSGLPLNPFKERVEVLCALKVVDYVTVFDDETADDILEFLKPDIHAKGTDYTEETVPERDTVAAYGGTIAIVGDPKDHSTTSLITRIALVGKKKAEKKAGRITKKKKIVKKKSAKKSAKKTSPRKKKKKTVKKKAVKKTVKKTASSSQKKISPRKTKAPSRKVLGSKSRKKSSKKKKLKAGSAAYKRRTKKKRAGKR